MLDAFSHLSDADLRELIAALKSRRIGPPYSELQVARVLSATMAGPVSIALSGLADVGFVPEQVVTAIEMIEADRKSARSAEPSIDLVTSGPEAPGVTNRDTAVVVRELFAHAQQSVLVVGYSVYQGQQVFEALAHRMEEVQELDVELFLNVPRQDNDTTASDILVSRFVQRFKDAQWPKGCRLPKVYYDPRSVDDEKPVRSSLHAKCVVVDADQVFVSSANFTEAGQQRNIEIGLHIRSAWLGRQLTRHFKLLHEHGLALRAI